jgi:hypothetical protein
MRHETTDGKIVIVPEGCLYCRTSTSGEHEPKCPLFRTETRVEIGSSYIDPKHYWNRGDRTIGTEEAK